MMLRYPLLLAFLLVSSVQAAWSQVYLIDLPAKQLTLPAGVYISNVVDARPYRASIGVVQRGLSNIRVNANLRDGLEPQLRAALPDVPADAPADHQLLLRVHRLWISEKTGAFAEKARAAVEVDFLWPQGDKYYVVATDADSVENAGMEVTARHQANILAAVQKCLNRLSEVNWSRLPGAARAISAAEIGQIAGGKRLTWDYPILRDSVLRAGVYRSFVQFRNNQADASLPVTTVRSPRAEPEWQGSFIVSPMLGFAPNEKPLRDGWGFSDGKNAYVRFLGHYYPLVRTGQSFSFEAPGVADPGAVSTAGALGGVIGAAIASASTSGKRTTFYVNMLTGSVSSSPFGEDRVVADTATVVIFRRTGKTALPIADVTVNGQRLASLAPGDYVKLPWTDKTQELRLCVQGNCLTFIPEFGKTIYLRCADNPLNTASSPFVNAPAKEGEFEMRKNQLRQQAQAKREKGSGGQD